MRNVIILGSGRSGTSMVAGTLSKAGYFMGKSLYPSDIGNPKGYFEDLEVNSINEDLLAQVLPERPAGIVGKIFFRSRPIHWMRWFAQLPVKTSIACPPRIKKRIKELIDQEPFCFKDPRFCYTLPVWRYFVKHIIFICVFRHPGITAQSLVKEVQRVSEIRKIPLCLHFKQALQVWELMYRHVLENHDVKGEDWLFLHYNQFLEGSAFDRLEEKLQVTIHREFVDSLLNRSKELKAIPQSTKNIYHTLCTLAEYSA